jgi:hypothetical protein
MSDRALKKMTLRLFEDDLEVLRAAYPASGYNEVVRALVSKHVRRLKNIAGAALEDKLSPDELRLV